MLVCHETQSLKKMVRMLSKTTRVHCIRLTGYQSPFQIHLVTTAIRKKRKKMGYNLSPLAPASITGSSIIIMLTLRLLQRIYMRGNLSVQDASNSDTVNTPNVCFPNTRQRRDATERARLTFLNISIRHC